MLSPGDPRLVLLRTNQKFLLVPIAFIGLRIWDIIADIVFVYMGVNKNNHHHYEALVYLDVSCVSVYVSVCNACVCIIRVIKLLLYLEIMFDFKVRVFYFLEKSCEDFYIICSFADCQIVYLILQALVTYVHGCF